MVDVLQNIYLEIHSPSNTHTSQQTLLNVVLDPYYNKMKNII